MRYYGIISFYILVTNHSFSKKLFTKGIIHISDSLSEDSKLLSWDHFRGKRRNFNDYLLIFGLSEVLPGSWRNLLHTENNDKTHQTERNSDLSLQINDDAVSLEVILGVSCAKTSLSHRFAKI